MKVGDCEVREGSETLATVGSEGLESERQRREDSEAR